jgi:hypothetical protein
MLGQGKGSGGVVQEDVPALEASPLLPDVTPPFPVMADSSPKIVCLDHGAPISGDNEVPALELVNLDLLDLIVLGVPVPLLPSHVRLLFRGLS